MLAAPKLLKHLSEDDASPPGPRHLDQNELSRRWTISPRTLERWRWRNEGPAYLKIGGRVVYRLEDVEAYEQQRLRQAAPHERERPDERYARTQARCCLTSPHEPRLRASRARPASLARRGR